MSAGMLEQRGQWQVWRRLPIYVDDVPVEKTSGEPPMNRRALLATVSALPFLASCAQLAPVVAKLPQYARDVQLIADALTKVGGTVATIKGIPAGMIATAESAIARIASVAAAIRSAAVSGAATVSGLLPDFGNLVTSLAAALGPSLPGTLGLALKAGIALLPQILAVAGVALAPAAGGMMPEEARRTLAALAR